MRRPPMRRRAASSFMGSFITFAFCAALGGPWCAHASHRMRGRRIHRPPKDRRLNGVTPLWLRSSDHGSSRPKAQEHRQGREEVRNAIRGIHGFRSSLHLGWLNANVEQGSLRARLHHRQGASRPLFRLAVSHRAAPRLSLIWAKLF